MNANTPVGMAVLGFVAAAISVLIFHQGMILILHLIGQVPNFPWSFRPNSSGVPQLISGMFFGGLYGILFAFVLVYLPASWPAWVKGIVLAVVINWFIANQILLPLIRDTPTFAALRAPARLHIGILISAAFGLGWILIYDFARQRFAKA
jgi:hypothetical protein